MAKISRVLLSVTDKSGILEFASALASMGAELISTGGTARLLRDAGIPVADVSDVTGFPEMLDGRVKTMHPKIAGGILAMRANPEHMAAIEAHGIVPIDMVVVNLYRFEEVAARASAPLAELMENIDIGGAPRPGAAAPHNPKVAPVSAPAAPLPCSLAIRAPNLMDLRYGENPHQAAALYGRPGQGIAGAAQLQGKELSYNNLVDLDAAWQLVGKFEPPAVTIVKHTNPFGCAEQDTLVEAYRKAFEADPVSAYGGVIGINRPIDEETAREIAKTFIEAIAAPDYSAEALAILTAKKNLRLMRVAPGADPLVVKSVSGGYLAQTADSAKLDRAAAVVKTQRAPSEAEWAALEFGWKVAKHVKSNAIVYARVGQTVGVGAGQMSRVDSVKLGAMKAVLPVAGTVVASDAFFPFADGVEAAVQNGATAFIQPGGSVRDAEVVAAADRLGVAMVFTGVRHFRH